MPYSNQYLPFGAATGANVLGNNSYNSLVARLTGFQSGVALSQQVNTPLRQSTAVASMIGAFIAAYGGDALDNGDLSTLRANFEAALAHIVAVNLPAEQDLSGYLQKSGGTMTGLLKAPAGHQTAARILSASTTLTTADAGKFVEITATSTVTTSLPTPVGNGGVYFTLWANSVSAQTIRTAVAGTFQGPGSSGGTTMSLPPGAVVSVFSDGYNWIVGGRTVAEVAYDLPHLEIVTSSSVWSKTPGATSALVWLVGGGGGGGGGGSVSSFCGGGGAGGEQVFALVDISSVETGVVVIGAGGAGGSATDLATAGTGGTTSFLGVTALGGLGGSCGGLIGTRVTRGPGGQGQRGSGTGFHIRGAPGSSGQLYDGGGGGGGAFGGGGASGGEDVLGTAKGRDGVLGGGGGGSDGGVGAVGGDGGAGVVFIMEW